ncbi:MAG: relaxase/mobilization nuclease domain-containing protein [Magnetovibrio sp.]|nr:relaxase/mobilization nuclease domain-containing protein [Magnetovibrio sp.]
MAKTKRKLVGGWLLPEEKSEVDTLQGIEWEFAQALEFSDHPRVVGTHDNTKNFHMHVGYSRIHPKTHKAHYPSWDFHALGNTCRAMEEKYGLKVDLGPKDKQKTDQMPRAARDKEAHSWEQSFYSYVHCHKPPLMDALNKAKGWQDLHTAFAKHDLVLRKRGNGLIIENRPANQHIKASALDRTFSKGALEKRFGPFQASERAPEHTKATFRYGRSPLTRHPDQASHWHRYLKTRNQPDSLGNKAFKTWREYLSLGAIDDPLAIAIIQAQKKLMQTFTPPPKKPEIKAISNKPKSVKDRDQGMSR